LLDDRSYDERDDHTIHRLPRLVDVPPNHLNLPTNFPASLLLTYESQGFPIDSLRNHFLGT
jgi:hypothetical protein